MVPQRSALKGRLCPQYDGAWRGEDAAIAMRDRGLDILDLTRAAFAAQLPHRLDQQKEAVHAGVAIRKAAAIRIDREFAAGRDAAARHKRSALALRAEAEIFEEQDRVEREGVIELDDIDVLRRQRSEEHTSELQSH